ncbi:hypothetical protein TRFO_32177 [Tritrichomonas foetus]|uniref:RRM domain-containing protein n=1 Tax=Tritrichomonas foetus TaxID=1144522 RepID=A0A1J4JPL0_9EUKA|nr:hypothetical protein TRFO_32177 [Tritrichomonas foetus]|eukprot:OHT00963.1 hypothetical protein TRFO_32177 [Tritrichomonas foetus]
MENLKSFELPYPASNATHTIFYKMESALEIKIYNLPLAATNDDLKDQLTDVFSLFGHIEEVSIGKDIALIKFQTEKGLQRAISQKKKHSRDIPEAVKGQFGVERYINKYRQIHPPLETLERVSSEYIAQFEEKEREAQMATGTRKVVKLTEAEQREMIEKYQQKAKQMQSPDFYGFQQNNKPNLATELLSNEITPRHLKKMPKEKKKPQTNQESQAENK